MPKTKISPKEPPRNAGPSESISLDREIAPSTRVLRQFRIVFNAVKAHFRQVERDAGIAGAQLWALSVIKSRAGLGVKELAGALDVHQSTASNLVKALIAQKMIVAGKGQTDRRAVTLHLTELGERLLDKAPMPFSGVLPDALAGLDAATLGRLEQDLAVLIGVLDVADARSANTPLSEM